MQRLILAALVIAAIPAFAAGGQANSFEALPQQTDRGTVSDATIAATPDLLSWDECRTRLDTYNGRELVQQQRVMDYCIGMERGREMMREEISNFPGRNSVSTSSIVNAPMFLPSGAGVLPTALTGR